MLRRRPADGAWVETLENCPLSQREVLLAAWLDVAPEAALAWYFRRASWKLPERSAAVSRFMDKDASLAWEVVRDAGDPLSVDQFFRHFDSVVAQPSVLAQLIDFRGGSFGSQLAMAFNTNGDSFKRLAATAPEVMARLCARYPFLDDWARLDPEAEAKVRAVATPGEWSRIEQAKRAKAASAEPEHAERLFASLPPSRERTSLFRTALLALKALDQGDDAFALAERELVASPPSLTPAAFAALAEIDPKRAKALAGRLGVSASEADERLPGDGRKRWINVESPAEAATTLSPSGPGAHPPLNFEVNAARWVIGEPEAASAWVQSLPAGAARDAAIAGMVGTLSGRTQEAAYDRWTGGFRLLPSWRMVPANSIDFDAALEWTAVIADPERRARTAVGVVQRWADADAARAAAALESGVLPADTVELVRRELAPQP